MSIIEPFGKTQGYTTLRDTIAEAMRAQGFTIKPWGDMAFTIVADQVEFQALFGLIRRSYHLHAGRIWMYNEARGADRRAKRLYIDYTDEKYYSRLLSAAQALAKQGYAVELGRFGDEYDARPGDKGVYL